MSLSSKTGYSGYDFTLPDSVVSELSRRSKLDKIKRTLKEQRTPRTTLKEKIDMLSIILPDDVLGVVKEQSAIGTIFQKVTDKKAYKRYKEDIELRYNAIIKNFLTRLEHFNSVLEGTNHIRPSTKINTANRLLESIPTPQQHTEYFNSPRISFAIENLKFLLHFKTRVPNPIYPGFPPVLDDGEESVQLYNDSNTAYQSELEKYDHIKKLVNGLIMAVKYHINKYKDNKTWRTRRTRTQRAPQLRLPNIQKAATLGGKRKSRNNK